MRVSVIIPVLNEEESIGAVLDHIPKDAVSQVIVVDNGSSDRTADVARNHGAHVVQEPRRGYGHACLRGIEELQNPDVVVFLDGDFSDYPEQMRELIAPIQKNEADLVIGSRSSGEHAKGALPSHAAFGNRLASTLIWWFFDFRYTDLGPFRAIRYDALKKLEMADRTFGWTVEMQIKAVRKGLRICEVPVSYRKRIGESKISGTISGSIKAGTKIIWTILKYRFAPPASRQLLTIFFLLYTLAGQAQHQEIVNVQVVNLQVSVLDKKGEFITELTAEDFLVWENETAQQVLDLEIQREPFSIGVLIDTSSSMQSVFQITGRGTTDFVSSLRPDDEFFVMSFDDRIQMHQDLTKKANSPKSDWNDFRYGNRTKLYEGLIASLNRLSKATYPRRAIFLISDGVNTGGSGNLEQAIELAQKNKVIIYSLILENSDADFNTLRKLSESTGGTYFVLYDEFPRLQAAYNKIAMDLAHRFTLYYKSVSDYSSAKKPEIKIRMKNPNWSVRFQRAYYPRSG
jgi:VWFA-related protein